MASINKPDSMMPLLSATAQGPQPEAMLSASHLTVTVMRQTRSPEAARTMRKCLSGMTATQAAKTGADIL